MKREVLVTGGAGFIGSELTRQLLLSRFGVTVLDDLSFGHRRNLWPGIRFVRGDIREEKDLRRVIDRRYDIVFHLAAFHFIPYCNDHPSETVSVNVDGTAALLSVLEKRPPKKFFFASTGAVYDISSRVHRESELPRPTDIYGTTKLAGERIVSIFHERSGVPSAVGRLFNAYGPRETNPHLIPAIVDQLKRGKTELVLGNLKPYRDYIHTEDMARAIVALASSVRKGFVMANIASGDEYSVREVVKVFSECLGTKCRVKSKAGLRRKLERAHLRADLTELRRRTRFHRQIPFREGIRALLACEGLLD
jgi:UDP-glucose 4-epimerase